MRILGVQKSTTAKVTSERTTIPALFNFLERVLVVIVEASMSTMLRPYKPRITTAIALQEYPKYFW